MFQSRNRLSTGHQGSRSRELKSFQSRNRVAGQLVNVYETIWGSNLTDVSVAQSRSWPACRESKSRCRKTVVQARFSRAIA